MIAAVDITDLEAIGRLLLAAALGVVGLEREAASQSAENVRMLW